MEAWPLRLSPFCTTALPSPRRGAPVSPASPASPDPGRGRVSAPLVEVWKFRGLEAWSLHSASPVARLSRVLFSVLRGRGRFGPLGLHAPFSVLRGASAPLVLRAVARPKSALICGICGFPTLAVFRRCRRFRRCRSAPCGATDGAPLQSANQRISQSAVWAFSGGRPSGLGGGGWRRRGWGRGRRRGRRRRRWRRRRRRRGGGLRRCRRWRWWARGRRG